MKGPVLLVVEGADAAARVAVVRADALSLILDAALHIARVLGEAPVAVDSRQQVLFEAERDLRRVCRSELPETLGADRLRVLHGDLIAEALSAIERIRPALVVLAAGPRAAAHATELAGRAAVPVLVARSPRPNGGIVAATDLDHDGYPVVQLVARLRARLEAPVALLHNVAPADPLRGELYASVERHVAVARQTRHLAEVANGLLPGAELETLEHGSAAAAILEAGARRDCDLIVVGVPTRPRGAFDNAVAETVVGRAISSVLVAPLG